MKEKFKQGMYLIRHKPRKNNYRYLKKNKKIIFSLNKCKKYVNKIFVKKHIPFTKKM